MVKAYWAILIVGLTIIQAFPTALRAGQAAPESPASLIAVVRQRIETDRLEVRVYQGKHLVQLMPFMELFVITPVPGQPTTIANLASKSVAIVRSEKKPERWEVYQDVWAGAGGAGGAIAPKRGGSINLTLADNVFRVKQVFISSSRSPIELRLDEQIIQLKPGDALLVL